MEFKFFISTTLKFGIDVSLKTAEITKELGYNKAAAIIDKGVIDHPQIRKILDRANNAGLSLDVYENSSVEPDYDFLEAYKKQFMNKDYDCLIGIGGGSTLDLTKGVAVLISNEGPAISFRGFPKLKNRPLPIIAIPTTAGTGSEVTYNAVFTDSHQKKKLGINTTQNFPVCAIIDPVITVNCPKSVTVSSGADALVHTLESYVHKNHTPISRLFSIQAFKLLFNALDKVLSDPTDLQIRGDLALGAYLAGIALINAGSGPAGAFSYPLGAVYKVSHGYAGAMFLSSITSLNVAKGYDDYADLFDLIEGVDRGLAKQKKNVLFAEKIKQLMAKLDVPASLSFYKLGAKDIEFMIEQYDVLKAAISQNPIEITKEDVRKMMRELA